MSNRTHAGPGPGISGVAELSLAERARTLAALGRLGSLSTHSRKFAGYPFGSIMPYALDEQGRPVVFVSSMAMHTQNLREDPRVSLLIMQENVSGDPLGAARLTLIGSALPVAGAEVKSLYLSRHENAKFWQDYSDFAYFRIEIAGVYFVGGFGVMGWIAAEEYQSASPDPLAEAASGIIQHMNDDHADALLLLARRFLGDEIEEAQMTAIDRLGFDVRLRSGDRVHGGRVALSREARDTDQARSVLVDMVRQTRSAGV